MTGRSYPGGRDGYKICVLSTPPHVDALGPGTRLESWKEIAAYLNRSERTVRRWEDREGLPVHRLQHDKRGSVYGYTRELDDWRESRRQLLEVEPAAHAQPNAPVLERRVWTWVAAGIAVAAAASVGGFWLAGRPTTTAYTPNPEAVRLVRQASFGGNAGRVQIQTGIRYLQEAIRVDPAFSGAWSGLASAHIAATWFGEAPAAATMTAAKREAREALRLDPSNGAAWMVLASAAHYLDWDHPTAEAHFRKAIDVSPTNRAALSWFGDFLTDMRRFEEARLYYKRAQNADPRWLEPITFAANTYTVIGMPDLAIPEQQRVLEIEPNFGLGIHFLGRSYLAKRDYTHAIELLRKSNEVLGGVPFSLGDLGYALGLGGQRAEAEKMLAELMAKRGDGYYPAFPIAQIHLGLGHSEAALDWIERAADERHMGFYLPSADPVYDAVRSHPRFRAVMKRMNLGHL